MQFNVVVVQIRFHSLIDIGVMKDLTEKDVLEVLDAVIMRCNN